MKKKVEAFRMKAVFRELGPEEYEAQQASAKKLLDALELFGKSYNLNLCDGEVVHSWQILRQFVKERTPKAVEAVLEATRRGTLGGLFSKTANPKGEAQ